MTIVFDTSIIIAVILNEPQKRKIIELTKGSQIAAPYSLHFEIGNAFSSMMIKKKIDLQHALRAIQIFKNINIELLDIDLEDTLKICDQFKIYAYDAFFLSLALKYNYPFMSLDKKLIEIAKKLKIILIEV
jgi:predicted nucleic acid-binding protein